MFIGSKQLDIAQPIGEKLLQLQDSEPKCTD